MSKANFSQIDIDGKVVGSPFYVQFNPKDLKLTDSAKWKVGDAVSSSKPTLVYEKGDPAKLLMELIFDSTDDMSSVEAAHVSNLKAFLDTSCEGKDADGKAIKQPYFAKFEWDEFTFTGVVEKMVVTYLMFSSTGVPVRAKVKLTMMEGQDVERTFTSNGSVTLSVPNSLIASGAVDAIARDASESSISDTYVVSANDTASSVAAQTGSTAQDIATANNLDNPMDIEPGTELLIPSGPAQAAAMAAESLSTVASNWAAAAEEFDPFGEGGVSDAVESLMAEAGVTPEALEAAMDEIGAATSAAVEAVQEVVDEAVAAAEAVKEEVEEKIEEVKEEVEEKIEEVKEEVEEKIEEVEEKVEEIKEEVEEKIEEVEEKVEEIKEEVEEIKEEVEEKIEEAKEKVEEAKEEVVAAVDEAKEQVSSTLSGIGGDDK